MVPGMLLNFTVIIISEIKYIIAHEMYYDTLYIYILCHNVHICVIYRKNSLTLHDTPKSVGSGELLLVDHKIGKMSKTTIWRLNDNVKR